MAYNARRRNILIALAVLIIVIILLLLTRCPRQTPPAVTPVTPKPPTPTAAAEPSAPANPAPEREEVLTPATVKLPEQVPAGAAFSVAWTGPDNPGDYVTIVRPDAAAAAFTNYRPTSGGTPLELTAPMEPGPYEVRYVTGRSHTVLGKAPVEVMPVGATLQAADEVILGKEFPVTWTGPNNSGDYVTIVPKDAPDEKYGSYTNTAKGSPLTLTAPTEAGDAELRYVSGQGNKVLARRPIRVLMPEVTITAPADAIAGSTIQVAWTGPGNAGDYITVVASDIPDGQYGNYTVTSKGSSLELLTPIMAGGAELRYMTGQGARVLARRPITIVAATITLAAPPECAPESDVSITWTGPNNAGDYITIVTKSTPDGQYGGYTLTTKGSPLTVKAPKEAGDAEVRYMTGQGNKVLARIPIKVVP